MTNHKSAEEIVRGLRSHCNYSVSHRGERWAKVDIFDLQQAADLIESQAAETAKLQKRIMELDAEIASREQSGIDGHNEMHHWRDRAKAAEAQLFDADGVNQVDFLRQKCKMQEAGLLNYGAICKSLKAQLSASQQQESSCKQVTEWLQCNGFSDFEAFITAYNQVKQREQAAVEELSGLCWCCVNGKKWDKAPGWSNMTTCEHMRERGLLAAGGGKAGKNCPHWQWRGHQEAGEGVHNAD